MRETEYRAFLRKGYRRLALLLGMLVVEWVCLVKLGMIWGISVVMFAMLFFSLMNKRYNW